MTAKDAALERVRAAAGEYKEANATVEGKRQGLADVCKDAYAAGANDREMSEITLAVGFPLSRARIQQFRTGKV